MYGKANARTLGALAQRGEPQTTAARPHQRCGSGWTGLLVVGARDRRVVGALRFIRLVGLLLLLVLLLRLFGHGRLLLGLIRGLHLVLASEHGVRRQTCESD